MDLEGFRKQLKKRGKKEHVVEELVQQVIRWQIFLTEECGGTVETSTETDFHAYRMQLEAKFPGRSGNAIRGIAMAYSYLGNQTMAELVSAQREKSISQKRKVFPLKDFRGIDPVALDRLAALGITDVEQMLVAGRTPADRRSLAERSGVDDVVILELVKLSDLSRLSGVKGIRARLYLDAGVDTVEKMAAQHPDDFLAKMQQYVQHSGFDGIPPLPKEIQSTIQTATKLEKVVEYET
jgi:hypothetical protein